MRPTQRAVLIVIALGTAPAVTPGAVAAQTLTPPDSTSPCRWMVDCSAPGTTLRMEEISRSGSGRGTKLLVAPRVSGFPAGVPLTFWMQRTGQPARWLATGYTLDASGSVVCADKTQHASLVATAADGWCPVPLDSIRLTVGDAMQGEAFAFAIATPDGRQAAYATVTPRPVAATVAGCGSLEANVLDAEAMAVRIVGRGFAPSAHITTESTSGRETVAGHVMADSTGRFIALVTPGTRGSRGGEASYTVKTGSCQVTLPYRWGRDAR